MKVYKKAISPLGFKANAVASGIKRSGKLDLALLFSEIPAKAAAQFTANTLQAAPLKVTQKHLQAAKCFKAIIVNSGNANCFTGKSGLNDAEETTKVVGRILGVNKNKVLVASTGIIGKRLPMAKIKQALCSLVKGLGRGAMNKAAKAMMTTDKFSKQVSVRLNIGNQVVTISGIAKGAGMIAPNMCTMLGFILTDASITQAALNQALGMAVENTFNCITVDGCMSTNDMVLILANAASKNRLIKEGKDFNLFVKGLNSVCLELAKMIVRDAEGASKFIQIKVSAAKTIPEAKKVALSIANSALFKTALFGESHNVLGRIAAAVGASGVAVKEKDLQIKYSPLAKKEINISVGLKRGKSSAIVYTSDLTPEYIKINAAYN